jgi:hypothetical protein
MVDRRVAKLIADMEQADRVHGEAKTRKAAENRRELEFLGAWQSAFTDGPTLTDSLTQEAAQRFLQLAEMMRERFWDFRVSESLLQADLDLYREIYVRLLAHSCAGNRDQVLDILTRARAKINYVFQAHEQYLHVYQAASAKGLPYTPPVSQKELVAAIGDSYDKFQWDFDQNRWQPHPADTAKYQRLRRWRHSDAPTHMDALRKIRENAPEKLWWKLGEK